MAENPRDLVGKEFIFEYGLDRIIPPSEETGGVFAIEQRCYRHERVVRCRDCAHAITSYQDGLPRCAGPLVMEATLVSPDGFCAWGEERERW